MLKTGHLFFNTAALVMNRYKNRAETGLQNLDNRAILCKVRGIGAAGSAFASHVKGRGFESHMLHGKGLSFQTFFLFVQKVYADRTPCNMEHCCQPLHLFSRTLTPSAPPIISFSQKSGNSPVSTTPVKDFSNADFSL